ncbi:MFS transporter [Novosphingobium sp. BL-52-GroH]|uniref:MFS transporter n=1 Tax=Novosphingobium sp. BL-52-GroH TaxID=3349877 RepID=UPI00384F50B8
MIKDPEAFPSRARANLLLAVLLMAYICSYLDRQILAMMVGPVRNALHISDFQISLLQGFAFALFFAFAGLPLGWLADRLRRTWIIAAGMLLWSLMTIACGFASSFTMLFAARMGLGIGEAALAPAGFSLLADSFNERKLVRATGIFVMGGLLGGGIAFFVGGYLINFLSSNPPPLAIGELEPWQLAFIVVSIPSLLLVPILLLLPEPPRRGERVAAKSIFQTLNYLWYRRRDYAPFYLTVMLLGVANYGALAWFPTHLIRQFGLNVAQVGAWLGAIQLIGSIAGTLAGAALTGYFIRKGRSDAHLRTIMVISCIVVVGMTAPLMPSWQAAVVMWFVAMFGFSGHFGSNVAAMQMMTPNELRGSNSALLLMLLTIGGLAGGTALVGGVGDLFFAGNPGGIGRALSIVGGGAAVLSVLVAWRGCAHFAVIMSRDHLHNGRNPN